jgi:hypothetical protein
MKQKVNLELKEITLDTNILNVTGITYNNHLYIDMQSLAQRAKISYKTVQRLVLKLKTINDRNSTYLLMINSPNKNYVSEIFLEKQKRKLVAKNQFSLLFDVFQKLETNKKTNEFETINNLNKSNDSKVGLIEPDPVYDDIEVLKNDDYSSIQQREYTVFYGQNKWQSFNNFHFELYMTTDDIELFMFRFFDRLKKEATNINTKLKLLFTIERNKAVGGGYHVHFVTSVDDYTKIREFHRILRNTSKSYKNTFNFDSRVYNANLKGLRYMFKECNLIEFRTGYYDHKSIV